ATRFPLAMAIAATGNTQLAYEAGKASAAEGRAVGVNVDFYPVVDVNNNPRNPIINIRSFGEDPQKVSEFARAYIRGVQDAGVLATAKHFPGHGDVASDSHLEMPVLEVDRQRLNTLELVPFRAAIEEGVGAIMSAHIYLPALESQRGVPATLSGGVLRDLLRKEMGFGGIVFTDAMTMRAISSNFKEDDAAIRAVEAGADIILYPPNVERVFNALKGAVTSGRLSVARLDESVRRLLEAKSALGLPGRPPADLASITRVVGSQSHRDLAQRINESAITVVRDERNVLPLRMSADQRLLHINLLDTRSGWREGAVGRVLTTEVPKRAPKTTSVQLDDVSTRNEYDLVRRLVETADAVLLTAFIRVAPYKGSIDLNREQLSFLRDLSAMKKPFVFVLFGSPYLLHHLPELPSYLLTYDFNPGAERAVVRAVFGEIPVKGKLPVSLPGLYPIGHGLER
ncbi:MAG TPA: glycoside hydrolase family 3 protein, partial [Thermoanaerobaculia bacterium]|nr:glycoside hydrolase family 3 protein [Thermoanaerobaculia bacterium]